MQTLTHTHTQNGFQGVQKITKIEFVGWVCVFSPFIFICQALDRISNLCYFLRIANEVQRECGSRICEEEREQEREREEKRDVRHWSEDTTKNLKKKDGKCSKTSIRNIDDNKRF